MRIIITGGLGHIGSVLFREIKEHEVIIVDNLLTQRYCSLFDAGRKFKFIEKGFENLVASDFNNVDAVVHLAAITDAASSFKNKNQIENINVEKTKSFIDLIHEKTNVGLFVFPSSTSVYGTSKKEVFEKDAVNPQSPYANSKYEIEQYLHKTRRCFVRDNFSHLIFRFGTIFGCSPGIRFHTAINKFCFQASYGQKVTVWKENFNQFRPYLGINDAISAIKLGLSKNNMRNETYNVLTKNYKLKDIIDYISSMIRVEIDFVNTPLLNQYSYLVNDDKIMSQGFVKKDDLRKEIIKTLRILKNE